ncbi:EamA family transporter [Lipingzhangella sp. LS1_29]|uniref:EamA family transporter n=1 Tax=Lipingzhangella rawalii TaxID=2055835 RepID=A0ABU2H6C1_9ACTN|nr:EamA family transporter [Lipingzhangella rawalii]MDS1270557.1 EamA family transporter [Lipingzhangella rawalii]
MSSPAASPRPHPAAAGSPHRSRARGLLLVVTAGILWGTGGIAGSLVLTTGEVHPFGTAAYRLLGGGLLTSLVLLVLGRLHTVPRTGRVLRRLLLAGVSLAVFQAGYFAAIEATSVSLATLLTIGSVPVLVTLGTCLQDHRWPGARLTSAITLALIGLSLLVGSPGGDVPPGQLALGVGCALLAGLAFTLLTLTNRHTIPGLDSLTVTAVGCLLGGLALLPLGLGFGMGLTATPTAVAALAYLAILPTAAAYLAYFSGLRTAPATAAALAVILEPLTAMVLAVLLLGEALSPAGIVGAVILLSALLLDYWRG